MSAQEDLDWETAKANEYCRGELGGSGELTYEGIELERTRCVHILETQLHKLTARLATISTDDPYYAWVLQGRIDMVLDLIAEVQGVK